MFKFSSNTHGDIILDFDGEVYDLGYNYTFNFPCLSWLYHTQSGQENYLFDKINPAPSNVNSEIEEIIKNAIEMRTNLPLPEKDFTSELMFISMATFTSGSNRTFYNWQLEKGILKLSKHQTQILELSPETNRKFIYDYYNFLQKEQYLAGATEMVGEVIRKLKENDSLF